LNKPTSNASKLANEAPSSKDAGLSSEALNAETAPDEISDAELVVQAQGGDPRAFEALVTRYRGKIYAMIYNMIHNDADAWDLAQDTFLKAWKALPKFEARSGFYTWIYRITHNVTYDWLRKKNITSGAVEFDDAVMGHAIDPGSSTTPNVAGAPDENMERSELGQRIREAIEQLSPDHRSVILLKEVEGLKYQEIADSLEITIGTVMSRIFYARKKLQALLADLYDPDALEEEGKPDES